MAMLREVFRHLFKRPVTVKYPFEKTPIAERYRGKHIFYIDRCVGCGLCARECPAMAIELIPSDKTVNGRKPVFYLDKCIFCMQCERICPRAAIHLTQFYELASYNRNLLLHSEEATYTKS
ncbi:MAG: NADH-quinone oxidoreductase subunit I [Candidatus Methanomethylicia archaeon]|nr:NADH-quinone oxidoreductase subunit I [Candidatus Methanomethylicia archaeon]MCX8168859.1 NADH-quinone oxidoreductase subunit I [Candidatus Methanomethylicia archaeon]MDW7988591.1 NADH-quinone oxidoreductase subunit I [Nitrososphaerota archaeon]